MHRSLIWLLIIGGIILPVILKALKPEPKHYVLPATDWVCTDTEPPNNECWEFRRIAPRSAAAVPQRETTIL